MQDEQPVDVLLPAHFDSSGRTRYHVLYLLHGAGGDYRSYVQEGIEQLLSDLPLIAVMPNGSQNGLNGDYTDWYELPPGFRGPAPAWETFHIRELVPFIDRHFPTIPGAAGHAIVGISMGGGGATKYAAEYPGTFGYVGTFSGEAHPLLPAALAFQPKNCRWGDPATNPVLWRDNDSADLAGNLRGIRGFIRSGNGTPGPFDPKTQPTDPVQAAVWRVELIVEAGAHLENQALVAGLRRAHVGDVDVRFFDGSHSWPYWKRDAREFVAWLRAQFARPVRTPRSFAIASAHSWFTAWGWTFTVRRRVREFAYVKVSGHRLSITGSGTVTILTPAAFHPGRVYVVKVAGVRRRLRADRSGAIPLELSLGPSHRRQQTRFGPSATRDWRTATATLSS
jgi:diacylglycerol O-acyltransferase / trehalose O-mycolyltransferase